MKIYHGTSFENAAKILSQDHWEYPMWQFIESVISIKGNVNWGRLQTKMAELNDSGLIGIHFTTNVNTAEIYARKNKRPVILMVEYDGKGSCDDFIINKPISADKIKCYMGQGGDIQFYGVLLNELYEKKCQYSLGITKRLHGLRKGLDLG